MNKKIMAIGIIAMFLLTGFTAVSARTAKQSENVEKAGEPTGLWVKPQAMITVESEDLKITADNVEINPIELVPGAIKVYKNVKITCTVDYSDYEFSNIAVSSPGMLYFYIGLTLINFLVQTNFIKNENLENYLIDLVFKSWTKLPGYHIIEPGPVTIEIGKMSGAVYFMGHSFSCRGTDVKISQN
jgi:hypothetical protein